MNTKFFLTASAAIALIAMEALCSITMWGQNRNCLYCRGYKANVQASVLISDGNALGTLSTSHGYSFGNGLYLGGGIGTGFSTRDILNKKNRVMIPVFMEVKYSFLKNSLASPFIDMIAGGAADYSAYGTGYFLQPSAGVDIWKFSISVGLGRYAMNYSTYDGKKNGAPAIIGSTLTDTGISISIAYNFR